MYVVVQQFFLHKLVQTPITSQYNVTLITFKNFVSSYVSEYLSLVFKKKPHYFKEYAFVKKKSIFFFNIANTSSLSLFISSQRKFFEISEYFHKPDSRNFFIVFIYLRYDALNYI